MQPAIPITDPRFVYTHSWKTDIRETFKKFQQQQQDKKIGGSK